MSTNEPLNPGELVQRNEALRRQVAELEKTNRRLRAELEQLTRRQQRQAMPCSIGQAAAQPKRPGRKPGQGAFRRREAPVLERKAEPAIAVPVAATTYAHCGGTLVEGRVCIAMGGNGKAAKSSDEIGRLAAELLQAEAWCDALPAGAFRADFRQTPD